MDELGYARSLLTVARNQKNTHQEKRPEGDMDNRPTQHRQQMQREIFRLVEGIEVTGSDAEKTVATALITKINILTEAKNKEYHHPTDKIDLAHPAVTIEITTPLPVFASAGAKSFVQLRVRYATGTTAGTVELEEGVDFSSATKTTFPNPNAKVIIKGLGRYTG